MRYTLIHNWRRAFEADSTFKTEVTGSSTVDAELKRLREENRQLKMERDILKKVAARSLGKENSHALMI